MLAKTYLKPTYLPTYSDSGDSIDGIYSSDISDRSDQQKRFIKKSPKNFFHQKLGSHKKLKMWQKSKSQNVTIIKNLKRDKIQNVTKYKM